MSKIVFKIMCATPDSLIDEYVNNEFIFRNLGKSRVDGYDIISIETSINIWDLKGNEKVYRKYKIKNIFEENLELENDKFFKIIYDIQKLKADNKLHYI